MGQQDPVRRDGPVPHRGLPVRPGRRHLDLADHQVRDAVQDRGLVGHVVIERHRLDAQLLGKPSHRQCVDAVRVSDIDGNGEG